MVYIPEHHANDAFLGAGCRRTVYAYDDATVLKIDSEDDNNYISTRAEVAVWERVKGTPDERYFARIVEYTLDGWLRMERVTVWNEYSEYHPEYSADYDYDTFENHPDWPDVEEAAVRVGVTDFHGGNLGVRADGSLCMLDYGAHIETYKKWQEPDTHSCRAGMPNA